MAKTQSKVGLSITIVVLVITLLIVGSIMLLRNNSKPDKTTTTTETSQAKPETTKDGTSTETDDTDASKATTPDAIDPETLTSVDVEPLGVTVFYSKGTPGFDFAVKRTADRTLYAEFTSSNLVGTKCTNDEGLIASIIKNPTSSEDQTTVSQTVKVGADTYGLSLAGKGCTSDAGLLTEYQAAFTNGFPSLKAL